MLGGRAELALQREIPGAIPAAVGIDQIEEGVFFVVGRAAATATAPVVPLLPSALLAVLGGDGLALAHRGETERDRQRDEPGQQTAPTDEVGAKCARAKRRRVVVSILAHGVPSRWPGSEESRRRFTVRNAWEG